jgi:hypothetical protein
MGLKHLPLVNIVLVFLSILTKITLGGDSLNARLRCLGFLVEGQRNMLVDFVVVIKVAFVPGTLQNKQLFDVPFSHNNHKRDPQKECYTHLLCGQDCHKSCKKIGWV